MFLVLFLSVFLPFSFVAPFATKSLFWFWCFRLWMGEIRLYSQCTKVPFIFFRPMPSWLLPGRSTSLYLLVINCEKHAMPSIGKAAKESKCGPLHSPYSCPSAVNHRKRKTKQNKNTTRKKQTKETHQKPGQLDSNELLMNSDSSLCAIICAGHLTSKNNTKQRTRWPSEGAEATIHAAETQDPPSQDPGDHKVQPLRHDSAPKHYE